MESEEGHAQSGVKHFGLDAVDILILEALNGTPAARAGCLIALVLTGALEKLFQLLATAAGREAARDRKWLKAGRNENEAALALALDYARSFIAEFLVGTNYP